MRQNVTHKFTTLTIARKNLCSSYPITKHIEQNKTWERAVHYKHVYNTIGTSQKSDKPRFSDLKDERHLGSSLTTVFAQ